MGEPRRPLIVIPARFSATTSALRYRAEVTAAALLEAVYAAGGEPLVIHPDAPPGATPGELDRMVRARTWLADGFLLPGGGDLAAHWAGQEAHETQYDVDETQDAFDLAIARVALTDAVPLLSVCRGTQVVNVARGGDMVQDLAETLGAAHRNMVHDLQIVDDSSLRAVLPDGPGGSLTISCDHHQGLGRLGTSLEASAFAADGTIEAVTLTGHPGWYLGVQWHPEDTADRDPLQAGIFRALIEAALVRTATRST